MKANKVVVAAMAGLVGVLALGACSSSASDQASTPNVFQSEREAAAKPSQSSTLAGSLSDVKFNYASGVNCQEQKSSRENEQIFECSNILKSDGLDAIFVKLPDEFYRVKITDYADLDGQVIATQRDGKGNEVRSAKYERVVIFDGDDIESGSRGWNVEIGTDRNDPASVTISILKEG